MPCHNLFQYVCLLKILPSMLSVKVLDVPVMKQNKTAYSMSVFAWFY